mmetsp:Transcript_6328/g.13733  ORF Transcript_6328/g.13733 Transcript_6328/m.13733 type:complete len:577 (+) Transcript_6328:62-1792(+)
MASDQSSPLLSPSTGGTATQRRTGASHNHEPHSSASGSHADNASSGHAAAAPSSSSSANASTAGVPSSTPTTNINHNVMGSINNISNATGRSGGLLSLLTLLLKLVTIILRISIYPLMKLSFLAFPPKEFDGLAASDRAAKSFVALVKRTISEVRPVIPNEDGGGGRDGSDARNGPDGSTGGDGRQEQQQRQSQQHQQQQQSKRRWQEHYVEPPCPFVSTGYTSTLATLLSGQPREDMPPLLLVYLHSPLHRQSTEALRNLLCNGNILNLLNTQSGEGNVICFGANVHTPDGARLRDLFGVVAFPFLALVSVKSTGRRRSPSGGGSGNGGNGDNNSNGDNDANGTGNNNNGNHSNVDLNNLQIDLHLRLEGSALLSPPLLSPSNSTSNSNQIHTHLLATLNHHTQLRTETLRRRLARQEEIRLRQEQDREYQEALLADQLREIARREEEESARREEEEREERERRKVEEEESKLAKARSLLEFAGEPPAGGTVARVRFTLPNGKKVDRRFHPGNNLKAVYAFLTVYFHEEGVELKNFGLSTNFPKRSFSLEEEGEKTLEEVGLCPQAVVMVQDLDA